MTACNSGHRDALTAAQRLHLRAPLNSTACATPGSATRPPVCTPTASAFSVTPPPTADRLNTPSQCQRAFTALGAAPRGTPEAPATGKVERRFEPRQNRLGTLLAYEKITDDVLGGGGKVPVNPEYVLSRNRDHVVLRNYEGKIFEYIEGANPAPAFKRSENFDSPEFV